MSDAELLILTDDGRQQGELSHATAKAITRAISRVSTAQLAVHSTDPLARYLTPASIDHTILKVRLYGQTQPTFTGRLVSSEKEVDTSGGRIACSFADGAWELNGRILGAFSAGQSYGPAGRAAIAQAILAAVNAAGDYTGVDVGTTAAGPNVSVGPWWYKPALEAIQELGAAGVDGFEWVVTPFDTVPGAPTVRIGTLNTYVAMGASRPNVVFEFGGQKANVTKFNDSATGDTRANRVYVLGPDAGGSVVFSQDATAIAADRVRGAVVSTDLEVDALRQELADEHVRVRVRPRRRITFDVAPSAEYQFGVHFDLGDLVTFRAYEMIDSVDPATGALLSTQQLTVDAIFRVFSVSPSVADDGTVAYQVTVSESDVS